MLSMAIARTMQRALSLGYSTAGLSYQASSFVRPSAATVARVLSSSSLASSRGAFSQALLNAASQTPIGFARSRTDRRPFASRTPLDDADARPSTPSPSASSSSASIPASSPAASAASASSAPALPQPPPGVSLPLLPHEQAFLAAGSSVLALLNPWRGDMVAVLSETTGDAALRAMRQRMRESAEGREILATQPRVDSHSVDLTSLGALPSNTFGHAYAAFMRAHAFAPEDRAAVRFVADAELAYVLQRYREAHDFWHVLCGVPISVEGELALKWLEMLQTAQPMTALAALVGPLRLGGAERAAFRTHYLPWALQCHRALTRPLISVYYERYLHMDLQEVRALLGVVVSPNV